MSDKQQNSGQTPADAAALRKRAEERARSIEPTSHVAQTPEETRRVLQELRVHQIELEMQKDELRTAQAEIEAGRARYFDLYDLAPVGYCTVSEKGLILEANLTAATLLGTNRGDLIEQPISRFIIKEDQDIYYLHRKRLFETGEPQEYELRLVKPDGALFWAHLAATAAQAADGSPFCRAVIIDITKRKRTEEENRRFRVIADTSVYGKAIVDLQGNLLYINRVLAEIHGYSPEELLGKPLSVFHSRGQMEAVDRLNASMMQEGSFAPTTVWHRHKDGTEFPMLMSGVLLTDDSGNPQCIAASAIDVTAQHQAEETLAESEEKHRRLFETMAQGVIYQAADGVIVSANPAAERILGLTFEQMQGKTSMDPRWQMTVEDGTPVAGEDHPAMIALRTGNTVGPVIRGVYRPEINSHIWLSITAIPLFQPDEREPFQVYSTFSDITERKEAEDALRQSEDRLRVFANQLPGTAWVVDRDLRFTVSQGGILALLGLKPDQVVGMTLHEYFNTDDSAHVAINAHLRAVTGETVRYEQYHDGLHFETIVSPIQDDSGAMIGVAGLAMDITDRKRAEEEREKLQAQLTQAQKMESVGRLAGGVAHDFNNMLGVILGCTEFAMEKVAPTEPLHADLEEIQKAAQRSAGLACQLLAFARKQTVAPKVLDLNGTIGSMLTLLRRLIGEDIDLLWKPGHGLWPVRIDPAQIDQILANLCVNARDAIAGVGKVTIETDNASFDEDYCARHAGFVPGDYALLAVSDNGCGMDAETISHLFEPFFTTKGKDKGTGLGLASVYGAVKQNNGFVNVYSEPDQGTTFKIYLPRNEVKAVETKETKPQAAEHGSETILLVEDEPAILELTTMMLERLGYSVLPARTPGEAIRLVREHTGPIDLVMTDVVMPEMNGRDLAKNLLSIYPDIRRLFMSGYTANTIAHHGVLDPGVHFIQKPFSMKDLGVKIREALG